MLVERPVNSMTNHKENSVCHPTQNMTELHQWRTYHFVHRKIVSLFVEITYRKHVEFGKWAFLELVVAGPVDVAAVSAHLC
jgi:hypothetical protein